MLFPVNASPLKTHLVTTQSFNRGQTYPVTAPQNVPNSFSYEKLETTTMRVLSVKDDPLKMTNFRDREKFAESYGQLSGSGRGSGLLLTFFLDILLCIQIGSAPLACAGHARAWCEEHLLAHLQGQRPPIAELHVVRQSRVARGR